MILRDIFFSWTLYFVKCVRPFYDIAKYSVKTSICLKLGLIYFEFEFSIKWSFQNLVFHIKLILYGNNLEKNGWKKLKKKLPFRGVLRKRYSINVQYIYKRTPRVKNNFSKVTATLLKSHFGMSVLLQIYCIFLQQPFLITPLEGCFCLKKTWTILQKKIVFWNAQRLTILIKC